MSADITFKLKRGVIEGVTPPSLTHGELAVNTTDKRLFVGGLNGEIIPFNKNYVSPVTPSNPIEGDYWFNGSNNYAYYDNSWVPAGGGGGSGGSFNPNIQIVFNAGLSGNGDVTIVGGNLAVLTSEITDDHPNATGGDVFISGNLIVQGTYPGAIDGLNRDQTLYLNRGILVTGGAIFANGMTAYGSFNLNGVVKVNGVSLTDLIVTGSSGVGSGANTFVGLQSFNSGLTTNHLYSTNGATFANGIRVTRGGMSITGGASITGGLTAYGKVRLLGDVIVDGSITVRGTTASELTVSPNIFSAIQSMEAGLSANYLYVSRGATFAGNGIRITSGGASITGGLTAYGNTNIFGTFKINGQSIATNTISTSSFNNWSALQRFQGGILVENAMTVTGRALFRNGIAVTDSGITFTGIQSLYVNSPAVFFKGTTFSGPVSLPIGITFSAAQVNFNTTTKFNTAPTFFSNAYFKRAVSFGNTNTLASSITVSIDHYAASTSTIPRTALLVTKGDTSLQKITYTTLGTVSDRSLKTNIQPYTESDNSMGIFGKKWLPSIRNQFIPYSFQYAYNGLTGMNPQYGFMADELKYVDPNLISTSTIFVDGLSSDESGVTGISGYTLNVGNLLFGTIEAIRELDAEVCRLWKTASPPPPSRSKDNDLWFDPETSKMYMRFNDGTQSQWIQTS